MTSRLFDPGPAVRLTGRQQAALACVKAAGLDGVTAYDVGKALGAPDAFARSTGRDLLKALKRAGHVRQRRGGVWQAVDARVRGMSEDIGF